MINKQNYQTNFKAIIPVKTVFIDKEISRDEKQIKSALNHFINILLKNDKFELQNPRTEILNNNIRNTFKSRVTDYFIPLKQSQGPRNLLNGQKIRLLEKKSSGDYFILTGKDANTLDIASDKIKTANSEKIAIIRANEVKKAKNNYGLVVRTLLEKVDYNSPKILIDGKKEKSCKITPTNINFQN